MSVYQCECVSRGVGMGVQVWVCACISKHEYMCGYECASVWDCVYKCVGMYVSQHESVCECECVGVSTHSHSSKLVGFPGSPVKPQYPLMACPSRCGATPSRATPTNWKPSPLPPMAPQWWSLEACTCSFNNHDQPWLITLFRIICSGTFCTCHSTSLAR